MRPSSDLERKKDVTGARRGVVLEPVRELREYSSVRRGNAEARYRRF